MKIVSLLISLMIVGSLAQAQEMDDPISYVKYCSGPEVVVNVEVYESGIVGWTVTDMKTGQNEQFMGFIGAGDSNDLQNEFTSTDLGSDIKIKGRKGQLILNKYGLTKINLKCD